MSRAYVFNQYGGPEGEELIERPVPEPGAGEIVVEVRAAGVNPADVKLREGGFGRDERLPRALGFEVSGTVVAVGAGVEAYAVGDDVIGFVAEGEGGFADHAVLRVEDVLAKPENISFQVAATIPLAGSTAYDLTHDIELEAGQTLLILGAGGGVGHLVAGIGRVHQFRVIGIASESKRALVESTGATFVASGDGAAAAVRDIAPDGVDLIVDLVGGQALRDIAPLAKSPDLIISAADETTALDLGGRGRVSSDESFRKMAGVIGYEVVTPMITAEYPLDRARDAIAAVESGHAGGKVVIVP